MSVGHGGSAGAVGVLDGSFSVSVAGSFSVAGECEESELGSSAFADGSLESGDGEASGAGETSGDGDASGEGDALATVSVSAEVETADSTAGPPTAAPTVTEAATTLASLAFAASWARKDGRDTATPDTRTYLPFGAPGTPPIGPSG
jgi:hypothetical protein